MPVKEKDLILNTLKDLKLKMDEIYTESFCERSSIDPSTGARTEWRPLMDVWRHGEEWLVVLDIPGVPREKLNVELRENMLCIWGERSSPSLQDGCEGIRQERPKGRFCRTVELPDDIESERIEAELKEGVLTIRIPKRPERPASGQRILVHRA